MADKRVFIKGPSILAKRKKFFPGGGGDSPMAPCAPLTEEKRSEIMYEGKTTILVNRDAKEFTKGKTSFTGGKKQSLLTGQGDRGKKRRRRNKKMTLKKVRTRRGKMYKNSSRNSFQ